MHKLSRPKDNLDVELPVFNRGETSKVRRRKSQGANKPEGEQFKPGGESARGEQARGEQARGRTGKGAKKPDTHLVTLLCGLLIYEFRNFTCGLLFTAYFVYFCLFIKLLCIFVYCESFAVIVCYLYL